MQKSHVMFALLAFGLSACNGAGPSGAGQPLTFAPVDTSPTESNPLPSGPNGAPAPQPTGAPVPAPSASAVPNAADLYTGPAEVAPFVSKFVADALIQGVDVLPDMKNPKLEIQLASLDSLGSSVIGLCESSGSMRRVTFDPDFWNSVSDTQKELLAHHELGHCILYRAHDTSTLSTGAYASIMYPIILSSATYTSNYDYYQKELFSRSLAQAGELPLVTEEVTRHICNLEDLQGAAR